MEADSKALREALRLVSRVAVEMTRGTTTGEAPTRKEVDSWAMELCSIIDTVLYQQPSTSEEYAKPRLCKSCSHFKPGGCEICGCTDYDEQVKEEGSRSK